METKRRTTEATREETLRFWKILAETPCTCGHTRSQHASEPPYECEMLLDNDGDHCDCEAFTVRPILDKPQRFVAIENRVHDNLRRLVCRARSGNMAKRIARALNIVKPNERGQ